MQVVLISWFKKKNKKHDSLEKWLTLGMGQETKELHFKKSHTDANENISKGQWDAGVQ